ncbi:MAG: DUF47 domain-containing protein [Planctomycetota bacterium]|jgi:predicted phosphate transport protein (TIGR00153 family)
MANWLASLFARSPFGPIQEHQHKVQECAERVATLIEAALLGDHPRVRELAKEISRLEAEADDIKIRVRDQLPRSLFMPVSRGDLLNVLAAQDSIADNAEDLGVLLSMREMEPLPKELAELLRQLTTKCIEVVRESTEVVDTLGLLVQSSFAGPEAQRVLELIDDVDRDDPPHPAVPGQVGPEDPCLQPCCSGSRASSASTWPGTSGPTTWPTPWGPRWAPGL